MEYTGDLAGGRGGGGQQLWNAPVGMHTQFLTITLVVVLLSTWILYAEI